jgi:hypothetical protein
MIFISSSTLISLFFSSKSLSESVNKTVLIYDKFISFSDSTSFSYISSIKLLVNKLF